MKKNFIKKLAFVMASALVVSGAAPAAQANAALKDVKLNKESKTLYLNADNKTGTKDTFDFNYKKLGKKADYKVKWSVEDDSIVDLAKGGVVTAKKVGTTTVYCKITRKSTGKSVTLDATVTVKANAKTVEITNVPEDNKMLVGVAHDFNRTMKSAEGKKATDKTAWEIVGDNTAEATVDNKGVVTAKKAGEFTLKASTYQSKATKADPTATAEVTIKVVTDTTEAKQTTIDKFTLGFLSNVKEAVNVNNVEVYKVVGTTKVIQAIEKISFDEAGTLATIELFVPFVDGSKYVVEVKDMTAREFTAQVGDVTDIVVSTTTAYPNEAKEIDVKLLNSAGIDITDADKLKNVEITTDKGWMDNTTRKLTLFNKGDVATLSVVYKTGKFDSNGKEVVVGPVKVQVTAVDKTNTTYQDVAAYTVAKTAPTDDFAKTTNQIAKGDTGYKLFVKVKKSDDKFAYSDEFTFTSSNNDILLVGEDGSLYPVKEGTAHVLIQKDNNTIGAVTIYVGAARKATTLNITESATISNAVAVDEKAVVKVEVLDQYGDKVSVAVTTSMVTPVGKAATDKVANFTVNADGNLEFSGLGLEGTYQYRIETNELTKLFTLTVVKPSAEKASYYRADLSSTEVDMVINKDNVSKSKDITVSVYGYAPNGAKVEKLTTGYTFKVTGPNNYSKEFNAGDVIKPVDGSTGVSTKMATGLYKVAVTYDSKVVSEVFFTLKDTQVAPKITNVKAVASTVTGSAIIATEGAVEVSTNVEAIKKLVSDCFEIKLNDEVIKADNLVSLKGTRLGSRLYVQEIVYHEEIAAGVMVPHTITIGRYITVTNK